MKILQMPRGRGKTTTLIEYSCQHQIPILVWNDWQKNMVRSKAQQMGLIDEFPEPLVCTEEKLRGRRVKKVLIDDMDVALNHLLDRHYGLECTVATLSNDETSVESWVDEIWNHAE